MAGRQRPIVFLAPATALGSRLTEPSRDEAFILEAEESGVDGAEGNVASRLPLDFVPDRNSVRFRSESHQGQKDELLEFTQPVGHGYFSDYVGEIDNSGVEKV